MAEEDEVPATPQPSEPPPQQQPEPPEPRDTGDRSWQTLNIHPDKLKKG